LKLLHFFISILLITALLKADGEYVVSTVNSSLAFEEENEQVETPMLNLLVKSRSLTHAIHEESTFVRSFVKSVDYVITGTITVSF
jgi:hypothetical protein